MASRLHQTARRQSRTRFCSQRLHVAVTASETVRTGVGGVKSSISVSLELINKGFDAIHRRCTVELLLLESSTGGASGASGASVWDSADGALDPRTWQPYLVTQRVHPLRMCATQR